MIRRTAALAGALALALIATAHAEPRRFPVEQTRRHLPGEQVYDITRDHTGWLWFATGRGLRRFDGTRVESFEGRAAAGDRGSPWTGWVRAIVPSRAGGLWVGLGKGAVVGRVRDDQFAALPPFEGAGQATLEALHEDADGTLWVATSVGLFRVSPAGERARFDESHGLPTARTTRTFRDRRGSLWIGTDRGLCRFVEAASRCETVVAGPQVLAIAESGDTLWVGTLTEGLVAINATTGARVATPRDAPTDRVRGLWADSESGLWVVSGSSLLHLENGRMVPWSEGELHDPFVHALYGTDGVTLWIGTSSAGAVELRYGSPFFVRGRDHGLEGTLVFAIHARAAGGFWVTSTGGLMVFEGGRFRRATDDRIGWDGGLRSLAELPDGTLYIGHFDGNLYRLRGTRVDQPEVGLPSDGARSLLALGDGTLLVGLRKAGLVRLAPGATKVETLLYPCRGEVLALTREGTSGVLVGTASGEICRLTPSGWSRTAESAGLPSDEIMALEPAEGGDLWVGTAHSGFGRLHEGRFVAVPRDRGLPFEHVGQLVRDGAGFLWVGSRYGLARVAESRLLDGGARFHRATLFEIADGMPTSMLTWAFPPSHTRTTDGTLWFPTVNGVVGFPRPEAVRATVVPRVTVTGVRLDGEALRLARPELGQLRRGRGNLEVDFTTPELVTPHRLRHRYRLVGFDDAFRDAVAQRSASYTNLPAGSYRFEVEVGAPDSDTAQKAAIAFTLVPPFTETKLFRGALALLLVAVVLLLVRARMARHRARIEAVVEERGRIARDLHDTLEQSLIATRLQLEAAERGMASPDRARGHIGRARDLVERSLRETKASVWALRTALDGESDLETALAAVIGTAMTGTNVALAIERTGEPYRLPPEVEREIVRIAQEAVTNALKHAEPRRITLTLGFAPDAVSVTCTDDGRGFVVPPDLRAPGAHYGLLGMRERAEALRGKLVVTSEPGAGSRVHLVVPAVRREPG